MLVIYKKLKKKHKNNVFFLFFDNINFYKYRQDQHLYNKNYQVIYTKRYVYFMHFKSDYKINGN